MTVQLECPECEGFGVSVNHEHCSACNGTGFQRFQQPSHSIVVKDGAPMTCSEGAFKLNGIPTPYPGVEEK